MQAFHFCEKAKGLTALDNQAECQPVLLSHSVCVTCVMSAENYTVLSKICHSYIFITHGDKLFHFSLIKKSRLLL